MNVEEIVGKVLSGDNSLALVQACEYCPDGWHSVVKYLNGIREKLLPSVVAHELVHGNNYNKENASKLSRVECAIREIIYYYLSKPDYDGEMIGIPREVYDALPCEYQKKYIVKEELTGLDELSINIDALNGEQSQHEESNEDDVVSKPKKQPIFRDCIQYNDPDKLLQRLHQLIDGKSGAKVGAVLLKAKKDKFLSKCPSKKEFESEFTLIKSWSAIKKAMNTNTNSADNNANDIVIF